MRQWVGGILIMIVGGCGFGPAVPDAPAEHVTVVLTFDDGPLAADRDRQQRAADPASSLDPLKTLLDVLRRRGLQAVFYVVATDQDEMVSAWRDGVVAVQGAGHVLGYHAYNHDAPFWVSPLMPRDLVRDAILADYQELQRFIDDILAPTGLTQQDVFTPVFREPHGGGINGWRDGPFIARRLGWVYHGYRIDSLDWANNADVPEATGASLTHSTAGDPVALVVDRLRVGAMMSAGRPVVDVLFHVNELTASHLDEWIDVLITAFEEAGVSQVTIAVPEEYLITDDPTSDLSSLPLLLGW